MKLYETYKQLFIHHQFGGIRTMKIHNRDAQAKKGEI